MPAGGLHAFSGQVSAVSYHLERHAVTMGYFHTEYIPTGKVTIKLTVHWPAARRARRAAFEQLKKLLEATSRDWSQLGALPGLLDVGLLAPPGELHTWDLLYLDQYQLLGTGTNATTGLLLAGNIVARR